MTGPVLYCGDPHGVFRHILEAARQTKASAIVLLGDMEPGRPLEEEMRPLTECGVPWYFIGGNHDADSVELVRRVWNDNTAKHDIHGRAVILPDGTRLAGLAGVFRGSVWYPSPGAARDGRPAFRSREAHAKMTPRQDRLQDGPHFRHRGSIYPDELDRLAELQTDVLVTHEAPGYHSNGFAILDTLAQSMGAKVAVHGHQHDRLDSSSRWSIQGFRSFGVGLRGITAIDHASATVMVPGELDAQRDSRQQAVDIFSEPRHG